MRKIEPEIITGMGYIGDNPGVLYRMGGAGEQTVVTGNPALLEGVKGSRFTSIAIYGKSTQGSTTGANILKDNYLSLCKGDIDLFSANGLFTVNANYEKNCEFNLYFSAGSIFADGINDEATYYIAFRPIGFTPKYNYQLSLKNERDKSFSTSANGIVTSVSGADLKKNARIQLYFFNVSESNPVVSGSKFQMIFSKNPDCNYEPYTGGAPSPSPSYPQEIDSAGQSGEIGIEVGNNGYIQKGTYFSNVRAFSLKKGYTYHIKCEKITTNAINCFVLNEYNKNLKNGAELYDYGYTTKKLTIPNSTGIVDKECMMPKRYDGDGYTFTVKAEGLYLYQAVNTPDKNTDELYIGYAPNILNEEYKKQTLIIPTPGGLPGIPVSSGGNYTDKDGQQWVADEIDLAMGERVQWIGKHELTGKENVADFGLSPRTRMVSIAIPDAYIDAGNHGYLKAVMSNKYKQAKCSELKDDINLIARGQQRNICFSIPTDVGIEDFKTDLSNQYASGRPVKVFYKLATPIRTPLPPETIDAYRNLHTYSPTTTVINDAGAGMSVGYKKVK